MDTNLLAYDLIGAFLFLCGYGLKALLQNSEKKRLRNHIIFASNLYFKTLKAHEKAARAADDKLIRQGRESLDYTPSKQSRSAAERVATAVMERELKKAGLVGEGRDMMGKPLKESK